MHQQVSNPEWRQRTFLQPHLQQPLLEVCQDRHRRGFPAGMAAGCLVVAYRSR